MSRSKYILPSFLPSFLPSYVRTGLTYLRYNLLTSFLPYLLRPLIQMVTDELLGKPGAVAPSKAGNALRVADALDAALLSFYRGDREHEFWERV